MLPLPAAENILASTSPTSQVVVNAFMPYGYAEIGVIVGALAILFIIGWFSHAFDVLLGRGIYTRDVITGKPEYQKFK